MRENKEGIGDCVTSFSSRFLFLIKGNQLISKLNNHTTASRDFFDYFYNYKHLKQYF